MSGNSSSASAGEFKRKRWRGPDSRGAVNGASPISGADDSPVRAIYCVGDLDFSTTVSAEDDCVNFVNVCLVLSFALIGIASGITRHLACSDGAPLELRGQSDLAAQQDVGNPTKTPKPHTFENLNLKDYNSIYIILIV